MLLDILLVIIGLIVLTYSADKFTDGASALAAHLGVPPLLIGLTIFAIGSSAPEIVVSATAALGGQPHIAMGNAVGSNIANIALVLGTTALICPLTVHSSILRREYPILLLVILVMGALLFDQTLSRLDGILLLLGFVVFTVWLIYTGWRSQQEAPYAQEVAAELPHITQNKAWLLLLLGLLGLPLGSNLLVTGASHIAQSFGLSDLLIGVTIIAIGTSLPELAASLASALKGEHEMAIGNIIGSNIFNGLVVMGLPGLIAPSPIDPDLWQRDYPVMLALTLLLLIFAFRLRSDGHINRLEGLLLNSCFIGYLSYLYLQIN